MSLVGHSTTERQVLRWTFRRSGDELTCELSLSADELVYELRVRGSRPEDAVLQRFVNVADAIVQQGESERSLIADGWTLWNYERIVAGEPRN